MDEDPPIQELTLDEYAQMRAQIEGGIPPVSADEATTLLGKRIWKLLSKGKSKFYIAKKLDLDPTILDEALNTYCRRLGVSIDHYRLLDNERIEKLIGYWLPIAIGGPINIQKIKQGEIFWECDFDRPLHASNFIIQAIEKRLRLFNAGGGLGELSRAFGDPDKPYNERQIIVWLREVLPSIERITRELELSNGSDPTIASAERTNGDQEPPDDNGEKGWFNGGSTSDH